MRSHIRLAPLPSSAPGTLLASLLLCLGLCARAAAQPSAGPVPALPPLLAPVAPPRVQHEPPMQAAADEDLVIAATVEDAHRARDITLHLRRAGEARYQALPFRRTSAGASGFSVTVPAERLSPGVIEYYIASTDAAPGAALVHLHFAAPGRPHQVLLHGDREARRRRDLLAWHLGNRSRLQGRAEYVNFGRRATRSGGSVEDSYWRAELDYSYRILGWVYSIRLGAGLLLGQTYLGRAPDLLQIPDLTRCAEPMHAPVDCRVGLYYGFAELRFRFGRLVRLDLRPILGVGPQTFDGGAGAQLLVGYEPGVHVAVGLEGISHVGLRGYLRLAWDTVPRVPMAFILDVENFPNNDAMAMRLLLNLGYRFGRHFSADVTAGYATRGWQVGGPSVGLGLVAEF